MRFPFTVVSFSFCRSIFGLWYCQTSLSPKDSCCCWGRSMGSQSSKIPSSKQMTLLIIQLVVTGNQDPERCLNIIQNENHESINYSSKLCFSNKQTHNKSINLSNPSFIVQCSIFIQFTVHCPSSVHSHTPHTSPLIIIKLMMILSYQMTWTKLAGWWPKALRIRLDIVSGQY